MFWYMNLFTTIDVVYTRMKRDTRIEIPVYKLIHVRKYTCLKPYVLQIICVWNHTRYKSYALQIIRIWNHTRYKSYAYEIIRVTNHTRMKWRHFICRIKTGSGGVCCHNARGRVRNRKSNPDGVAGGIWRTVRTSPSALWQQTPTDRS